MLIPVLVVWGCICKFLSKLIIKVVAVPAKLRVIALFLLAPLLFILPLIDEIFGSVQFHYLCKDLPKVEINQENNVGVLFILKMF